ncbi:MAG: metal ABC transporter substrate-binding protein [Actinomycetota bacterium]|nr:metal ABC transporter substrate-binding protein [Actinomycetota bacterium]
MTTKRPTSSAGATTTTARRGAGAAAAVALLVVLATALAGCGGSAAGGPGTSVVAGFYPFAFVAERVAGEHASVSNLTDPGAEPHDLELSPQQVAGVAEADVVVYQRGFQPAVDDAVAENAGGAVVEVGEVVGTGGAPAGDPHVWQDPTKLAEVARTVADRLAKADAQHADAYRDNADALVADLRALDRDFRQGLARCERRTIVTSHAAFGHLAARYDLQTVPIAGISPDSEPSPARLAQLQRVVEARDVTTVFTETLASPRLARTLAEETGVGTAVLDPVEGLSPATSGEDYLSLMRANLAALQKANGCT